ncbi:MAG TPA: cytochrome c oxidase subunit 3 [Pyrinomonadaceae bacterium]|nr:cytochrome c oxidase subunit 3 [Pyrinomonadaceae bacterium]
MSAQRTTLDVSGLPKHGFDAKTQLWWGNVWLLCIETTMFGLVVAAYFYFRQNFTTWPPPHSDSPPYLLEPVPRLLLPTINLAVIILSVLPMAWADAAARRLDRRTVKMALILVMLFGTAATVLRFYEFRSLVWSWDSNAYGSVSWAILALHLVHLIVGTLEDVFLATWVWLRPLDENHALDITVTAVYWYWVVGTWLVLYPVVYLSPRFM